MRYSPQMPPIVRKKENALLEAVTWGSQRAVFLLDLKHTGFPHDIHVKNPLRKIWSEVNRAASKPIRFCLNGTTDIGLFSADNSLKNFFRRHESPTRSGSAFTPTYSLKQSLTPRSNVLVTTKATHTFVCC